MADRKPDQQSSSSSLSSSTVRQRPTPSATQRTAATTVSSGRQSPGSTRRDKDKDQHKKEDKNDSPSSPSTPSSKSASISSSSLPPSEQLFSSNNEANDDGNTDDDDDASTDQSQSLPSSSTSLTSASNKNGHQSAGSGDRLDQVERRSSRRTSERYESSSRQDSPSKRHTATQTNSADISEALEAPSRLSPDFHQQVKRGLIDDNLLGHVSAPDEFNLMPRRPDTIATCDRLIMVKTPTTDQTIQTSRRPTWDCVFKCKYGYHFPSSPTPSMISDLAKQIQCNSSKPPPTTSAKTINIGRSKITLINESDEQIKRLKDMFPTTTVPIIEQMIRIYHGREGLIKAALISLGYRRYNEYEAKQATVQSPIMLMMSKPSSKKLFDKLISYFPDKDETLIKELMFRYKEVEHEIISALVESTHLEQGDFRCQAIKSRLDKLTGGHHHVDRNGSIMKLRYLKFLYPSCQEIELYHLLHCNDLNVQRVIEIVEKRGHSRANVDEALKNRQSQTQQMRAAQLAHAAKDKEQFRDIVEAHRNRTKPTVPSQRVIELKDNLKKVFPELDDEFLIKVLAATDYNEGLVKKFISEMPPIDDELFKQRYEFRRELGLDLVAFPCKAIQKDDTSFMSIMCNENVYISREIVECKTAVALLKKDASTCTDDDFEPCRITHRIGPNPNLALGPKSRSDPTARERQSLRLGPTNQLQQGSRYASIVADENRPKPNKTARSHNKTLIHGPNRSLKVGHNAALLQRLHPFFRKESTRRGNRKARAADRCVPESAVDDIANHEARQTQCKTDKVDISLEPIVVEPQDFVVDTAH